MTLYLDPAPLLAAAGPGTAQTIATRLNVTRETVERWKAGRTTIPHWNADNYAIAIGCVPYELWPELLEQAVAEVERPCETCGATFVLTTPNKRFCSRRCRETNPDKIEAFRQARARRARRRYQTDPEYREKKKAKVAAYRDETRPTFNAYRRAYYQRNAEAERARSAAYRARVRAEQNAAQTHCCSLCRTTTGGTMGGPGGATNAPGPGQYLLERTPT